MSLAYWLLFLATSEKQNCLEDIREWLFNYITPFLYSNPRDQTDLREKTLAISAYYFVENLKDQNFSLFPRVSKYGTLIMQTNKIGMGDSFLAFATGLLFEKNAIHVNALGLF